MTGLILGMTAAGLYVIGKWDKPLPLDKRKYLYILGSAFCESVIIRRLTEGKEGYAVFTLSVVGGSLLLASVTDLLICQVYHFIWWPGLAAALLSAGYKWGETVRPGEADQTGSLFLPLLLFCFLQLTLFRRAYGRADCYAFCVCAVTQAAAGYGMTAYLTHMFLAYALLIPVQTVRRNIDARGRLKKPAPFLPYIMAAFWLTLILQQFF